MSQKNDKKFRKIEQTYNSLVDYTNLLKFETLALTECLLQKGIFSPEELKSAREKILELIKNENLSTTIK